jgi:hypothetical protein
MKGISIYFIIILVILIMLCFFAIRRTNITHHQYSASVKTKKGGSCDAHTCGAIDPVSDPDYNMRQIIRQSILLEEHLAEDRKYCKDCICKHFNHIIGLSSEAVSLAGDKINSFPLMSESTDFYEKEFQVWLKNRECQATRQKLCTHLRERRKELMKLYYLQ